MANVSDQLKAAMAIDGAIGVALVDYSSGMTLGIEGGSTLDMEVAAAGNTDVVRANIKAMQRLGFKDTIEDILITLSSQIHIIRPLASQSGEGLFLYVALDKSKANLAMARRELKVVEQGLIV